MSFLKPAERRAGWDFVLGFILLAAGILAAGFLYYWNYELNFRSEAGQQLSAIADLKADQLVQYRKERLGDAAIFFKNAVISTLVRHFLETPEDEDAQRQIQIWIEKYQKQGDFDVVRLLDVQGATRLSSPSGLPSVSSVVLQRIPEILRAGQVTFLDFHRNEYDQQVYLDILVPILDEQDAGQPLGLFYLRINPKNYLYPFIKQWPLPSETAETLLVRREGNEVVFLNELRFQTNAALNLRIPLANTNVLAVKAVLGQTGIVEGLDYRGVPVIGDIRAVPGSPWFIVARQDAAEVFAPLRAQFWQLTFTLGVLLLAAGAGTGLVWRQQRVRFLRDKLEAQADRARLGAIVESSEDAIIGKNLDGTITSWNAGAERIYGYSAAETVGKSIALLIPTEQPDELPRLMEKIRRGEAVKHYETGRVRKNGERIQMSLALSPVKDAAGAIVGVSAIGRDITERKRAEDALRESEERFRRVFEEGAIGMVMLDEQFRFIKVNPAFASMLGYSVEELQTMSFPDITHPDNVQKDVEQVRRLVRGEISEYRTEKRYLAKSGKEVWGQAQAGVVRTAAGKFRYLLAIISNVTERKAAELQLQHTLADLERSNQELEQFAYVASHDLQEPLRMVSSYTQLLAKRFEGQLDEKTRKYVHYAVDGAIRMKALINDLLAYSRVGSKGQPLRPADLHAVLGEAMRNLAALIEENKVVITHDDLPTVRADTSQLVLVFQNLLANAIKFRRDDLPRIHVSARDRGGEWVFAVKDNGIGIELRHADRVFVIFQRLHSHEEYPGTGIGLAVCKRIVERHGGKIWFESGPENGTTFFFTIPK